MNETKVNKSTCSVLLGLLLLAAPAAVQAQFTYETNGSVITLTRYSDSGGAVTISNFVTSIGNYAFDYCTNLTSVTIPDSVTSIGEYAFSGSGLTNATIGSGVTSIGQGVFWYCTALTSVTIPDSVTSIGDDVFYECTSLTSVTIPDGVTSIGQDAFAACSSLTSLTIPGSVTSIGEEAFDGCSGLTSVTIGSGVTSIGDFAFYNCTRLSSVFFMGNAPATPGPPAFDVVADFSTSANPNGVWSYGWSTAPGEPFQLATTPFSQQGIAGALGWDNGLPLPDSCWIAKDFASIATIGTLVYNPDTLHMDPQSYEVMARFTVPSNGSYQVSGLFRLEDTGTHPHDLSILVNGNTTNFHVFTSEGTYNSEYPFNFSSALTQGETLDFIVACHNGDFQNLGTGLKAGIATVDGTAFEVGYTTVYYLPGTTGWNVFAATTGIPAVMLNPPPGTMVGDGFLIEISSGTSPLASYGFSILLVGDSGNSWNLIGIYNVQDDSGTYTYTNAGAYATVIMNDATETDNIRLTFTSPTQGAFFSDITYPPAYSGLTQSGNFVAATGTALNSIAGSNVLCSVANGYAPFAASGSYTIVFVTSGNTYVMKSSTGVITSSGRYSYSVVNRSTAAIQITDSVAGSFTVYVGFSNQLSGGYAITQSSTGGFQIGSFSISGTTLPVQAGSLQVTITPAGAITAGAQWQVDGGILLDNGAATDLPVGNHTISFNTVSGWTTPANQTVSIKANSVAKAKGTYIFSAQGIYNGLFMQAEATEETAGMLKGFDVTASGNYSGLLLIGGSTHSVSGGFDVFGQASNRVPRTAKLGGPLTLEMTLNWNDSPPNITGTVSGTNGGAWVANLTNELAAKGSISAEYTALVLPDGTPPGHGYILITNHAGAVTLSVTLADGTSFSQAVPVSGTGDLPVYGNLYEGTGLILGWLGLESGSPTGNLTWIKPASRSMALYTNGFTNLVFVQVSLWTNPLPHTAAIDLPSGQLDISDGSLRSPLTFNVAVSNNNALVKLPGSPTNSLTGSINAKTGLLTATFGNGAGRATTAAKGAVLQNVTNAAGFFLGKTNAGSIVLQP